MGYSPWGCKESDTTEGLTTNVFLEYICVSISMEKYS